jgi:hypothetical protein
VSAYEQASMAWHGLWGLSRKEVGSIGGAGHRREANLRISRLPGNRDHSPYKKRPCVASPVRWHDQQTRLGGMTSKPGFRVTHLHTQIHQYSYDQNGRSMYNPGTSNSRSLEPFSPVECGFSSVDLYGR